MRRRTMSAETQQLDRRVATLLRQRRTERLLTQATLAEQVPAWNREVVRSIERYQRRVSAAELLLLTEPAALFSWGDLMKLARGEL